MTDKQKLKSIEKKMQRIQSNIPDVDLKIISRHHNAINTYSKLSQEHFMLEFNINHCQTCGKKL